MTKITKTESYNSVLNRALSISSYRGHKTVAEVLIQAGADVNTPVDPVGCMWALSYVMDITTKGKEGRTAIQAALGGAESFRSPFFDRVQGHKANTFEHDATILLLLEKGAEVITLADEPVDHPFHTAAKYCSESVVKLMIDKGADIETGLQACASRELSAAPIAKILLQTGATITAPDAGISSALDTALAFFGPSPFFGQGGDSMFIESESIQTVLSDGPGAVIKLLLRQFPETKAKDERYGLLLQMVAMVGDREFLDLLLQRQVNVNGTGHYYQSALQAAARVGNLEVVQLLLGARASVNLVGGVHGTALAAAVVGNHVEIAAFLIEHGADVSLQGETQPNSILQAAVEVRHQGIIQLILAAGADVNAELKHPGHVLLVACGIGDDTSVQLLLAAGANINVSGKLEPYSASFRREDASPLHMASQRGYESVVTTLLAHGADIEKEVKGYKHWPPFIRSPEIEKQSETSGTPLLLAAITGHVNVVRSLVAAGANVNYNAGGTALSVASTYGHFEVVQELLKSGASIATPMNALYRACAYRRHQIIVLLLEELCGTVEERSACTQALFAACTNNDDNTFQLLLGRGALQSPSTFCQASIAGLEGSV